MIITMVSWEHPQRAIQETCDLKIDTWKQWLHLWQLRTTILTFTLWPLHKERQGQHSQFLPCFFTFHLSSNLIYIIIIYNSILTCQSHMSKVGLPWLIHWQTNITSRAFCDANTCPAGLSSEAMDFSKWESSISQSTTWYNRVQHRLQTSSSVLKWNEMDAPLTSGSNDSKHVSH